MKTLFRVALLLAFAPLILTGFAVYLVTGFIRGGWNLGEAFATWAIA